MTCRQRHNGLIGRSNGGSCGDDSDWVFGQGVNGALRCSLGSDPFRRKSRATTALCA